MCHSCIEDEEGKNKNGKRVDDFSSARINKCETIGVANESDVSPNTPRARADGYNNIDTLLCRGLCRSNTAIVNYRTAIENMHTFSHSSLLIKLPGVREAVTEAEVNKFLENSKLNMQLATSLKL
jgi:hypothetical protein